MIARYAGTFGTGTANPLRDRLLGLGEEILAAGCARHEITSMAQATEMLNGAYGWEDAVTDTELDVVRSLIGILDRYIAPSDAELLHWL